MKKKTAIVLAMVLSVIGLRLFYVIQSTKVGFSLHIDDISVAKEDANIQLTTEQNDVVSPKGKYILHMNKTKEENVSGFHIEVKTALDKRSVFKSTEFFRLRDVNYLLWGENDSIWLYNGDLGTFYWTKTGESWEKKAYSENEENVKVPDVLKQLKDIY